MNNVSNKQKLGSWESGKGNRRKALKIQALPSLEWIIEFLILNRPALLYWVETLFSWLELLPAEAGASCVSFPLRPLNQFSGLSFWEQDPERSQESQEELEAALPAGFPDAQIQGHSFVLSGKCRKLDSFFNPSTNSKGRCVISLWSCSVNFPKNDTMWLDDERNLRK